MAVSSSSGSGSFNETLPGGSDGWTSERRQDGPRDKGVYIELPAGVIWVEGSPVGRILSSMEPGGTEMEIRISTERVFEVLQSIADMGGFCQRR